ncbi:MAG: hypothetical protein UU06_C0037G0014 [Parcubacteria group bacterium GW2011_GWB1_40_5]|nr:MAG: hypothetical protein UU06_C0037G0014 [Parcubacteria group bacterium GW2011_GWB1_40_5]
MISKKRRILRKDFAYILNNSKRYNTDNLLLFIAPINSTAGREESRISFSVSKKVQPLAFSLWCVIISRKFIRFIKFVRRSLTTTNFINF